MNAYQYLFWLAEQSLVIYALPFNIALLAVIILITRGNNPPGIKRRLTITLAIVQFIIPIALVFLGTWFRDEGSWPAPSSLLLADLIFWLFVAQIPLGIYAVVKVEHSKLLVASLSGVHVCVAFVAWMVAGMSIAGDWM